MTQTSIDWAARGIVWSEEDVSKQHGDHATDRVVIGKAQIPVVVDLTKFVAHYGEACVLGIMDGTSARVMAQDVGRSGVAKKLSADEIRARVDARLSGIRNRPLAGATKVVEVAVRFIGAEKFTGTTEAEYKAAWMAHFVDAGLDATVARMLAESQQY